MFIRGDEDWFDEDYVPVPKTLLKRGVFAKFIGKDVFLCCNDDLSMVGTWEWVKNHSDYGTSSWGCITIDDSKWESAISYFYKKTGASPPKEEKEEEGYW